MFRHSYFSILFGLSTLYLTSLCLAQTTPSYNSYSQTPLYNSQYTRSPEIAQYLADYVGSGYGNANSNTGYGYQIPPNLPNAYQNPTSYPSQQYQQYPNQPSNNLYQAFDVNNQPYTRPPAVAQFLADYVGASYGSSNPSVGYGFNIPSNYRTNSMNPSYSYSLNAGK